MLTDVVETRFNGQIIGWLERRCLCERTTKLWVAQMRHVAKEVEVWVQVATASPPQLCGLSPFRSKAWRCPCVLFLYLSFGVAWNSTEPETWRGVR